MSTSNDFRIYYISPTFIKRFTNLLKQLVYVLVIFQRSQYIYIYTHSFDFQSLKKGSSSFAHGRWILHALVLLRHSEGSQFGLPKINILYIYKDCGDLFVGVIHLFKIVYNFTFELFTMQGLEWLEVLKYVTDLKTFCTDLRALNHWRLLLKENGFSLFRYLPLANVEIIINLACQCIYTMQSLVPEASSIRTFPRRILLNIQLSIY